jgi:hypothetical protein
MCVQAEEIERALLLKPRARTDTKAHQELCSAMLWIAIEIGIEPAKVTGTGPSLSAYLEGAKPEGAGLVEGVDSDPDRVEVDKPEPDDAE